MALVFAGLVTVMSTVPTDSAGETAVIEVDDETGQVTILDYAAVDEWYINGPGGLEQGFNVAPLPQQPGGATGSASATANIYGVGLPEPILRKVYWENAARLIGLPADPGPGHHQWHAADFAGGRCRRQWIC